MTWTPSTTLPDSETTVLIVIDPDCSDEPVWLGYHDGEQWRTAEGALVPVTHWMNLPKPLAAVKPAKRKAVRS